MRRLFHSAFPLPFRCRRLLAPTRRFCPKDGILFHNQTREELPTIRPLHLHFIQEIPFLKNTKPLRQTI
jgi:hypothetical protein